MIRAEAVEQAFVATLRRVEGIASAVDHEPGPNDLGELPCVTMLFTGATQNIVETGAYTDDDWTWRINLYVELTADFREAQMQAKRILKAILDIVRDDRSLSGAAGPSGWVELRAGGREPVFNIGTNTGYLVLSVELVAHTTER